MTVFMTLLARLVVLFLFVDSAAKKQLLLDVNLSQVNGRSYVSEESP